MYAHKKDMYKMYMKKTLKNRIREEQNKWKHVPYTWIGIMSIVKMSVLPYLADRVNAISAKPLQVILWILTS